MSSPRKLIIHTLVLYPSSPLLQSQLPQNSSISPIVKLSPSTFLLTFPVLALRLSLPLHRRLRRKILLRLTRTAVQSFNPASRGIGTRDIDLLTAFLTPPTMTTAFVGIQITGDVVYVETHGKTLQATSHHFHHALNCHLNPAVWSAAFRFRFDHHAVLRRNFRPNGRDYYHQLRQYTKVLAMLRRQDLDLDAGEGWRMVYLMLLDNNGKNRAQLEHAGIDLLFLCYLQERLWENADENDGWPKDTAQSVHVLWAMWMLTTPAKLQAETRGDRDLVVRKILPFVLNPYRYHQAEAPPSHFHLPLPSGQNSTFLPVSFPSAHGPYPIYVEHQETAHPYFGSISLLSPPPITTAAKLLYFAHREIIPFNIPPHLPRTRAEAQPSTTPSPTQEDFIEINSHRGAEFQPCITWDWDQGHRLVNGVPDTSDYDHSVRWDPDYWRRRLCGDAWQAEPKWRPGKVYVPGSMDGLWQGRLVVRFPVSYGRDYYDQLRQYTEVLSMLRRQDLDLDAGEGWRMVYLMLLDNNGKNRAQLEHAGIDLLFLCYLQERLWENADENDGWPKDTAQSVHVLWAMWMLTTPAKLQAKTRDDRDLVVRKILPFVLNPYRYHQAEAPPSHFHLPLPSGQNSTFPFLPVSFPSTHGPYPIYVEPQEIDHPYFGSISQLSPPPITTAAKLLYFAHREIIPFNIPPHLPRTRAEAQPSTTPSPTQEDFIEINSHRGAEFQPCITWDWDQGHRLVNGVPDTSNYDHSVRWDPDYWRRRLCGDAWQVEPKWRPGKVYVPGSMDGLWQGRLVVRFPVSFIKPTSFPDCVLLLHSSFRRRTP
ncbi:hypothetical protein AN958_11806 [Leucoagaricus sp. SymC.cos]|nr:hypothetical protein AN958_11806 [Leucoagaricus sp. SymC.cos]